MAATVRMNRLAIATGPFGDAVARRLLDAGQVDTAVVVEPSTTDVEALVDAHKPDLIVGCFWRYEAMLGEAIDRTMVPWIPSWFDHPYLAVGPAYVDREQHGCQLCFSRRLAQHELHGDIARALHEAMLASDDAGPQGYLPSHVSTLANLVTIALDEIERNEAPIIRRMNVIESTVTREVLVPIDRCPRCEPAGSNQRSWERLSAELSSARLEEAS